MDPVFFIRDAVKFTDLAHTVKPESHKQIPQAASAEDTFWDFVSLMLESTHMLMWQMSDRAKPRRYATMQGFGVSTFKLVKNTGKSVFCKFHSSQRPVTKIWSGTKESRILALIRRSIARTTGSALKQVCLLNMI